MTAATVVDRIPRGPRGVAILGIVLGLVGLELALPPLQVRAAAVPVALGVCAMACARVVAGPLRAASWACGPRWWP